MTIDDIHLLYEYNRWANNRVLHAATALIAGPFIRDPGTYRRGHVAGMMRQLVAEPLATDFHVFLMERTAR